MRTADHVEAQPLAAVHVTSAEAALVAQKVTIHLIIEPVHDAAQGAITLAGVDVATHAAGGADTG